jgi:DNA processing protein
MRRSALLGWLAPHIETELGGRRRLPAILSLDDRALIESLSGKKRSQIEELYSGFDVGPAREKAKKAALHTLCKHENGFPAPLLEPPDAPSMLYLRGDSSHLRRIQTDPAVAVVGSRRASPYGLEVARALGRELSACGVVVVSGMAFGIDSAAHEGALEGAGLTVAVLGSGADQPYPRSKRSLYTRIASSGLIASELPPGQTPFRWCFPARNRIIAALARMTVVVEGTDNSGSLITARFAADLGKEVGAVPGQITSSVASGPNQLLADGACLVRSAADVLDAIYGPGSAEAHDAITQTMPGLTDELRALLESVEHGSDSPDAIASTPADVPEVMAGLTELELMGLVRRGLDGRYIRCP